MNTQALSECHIFRLLAKRGKRLLVLLVRGPEHASLLIEGDVLLGDLNSKKQYLIARLLYFLRKT